MSKRNLFEELTKGFEEIHQHQQGKITLKTETLSQPEPVNPPNPVNKRSDLGKNLQMFGIISQLYKMPKNVL